MAREAEQQGCLLRSLFTCCIALLADVIEKKFVIFGFWLVVVVANVGGCFLEFACAKNNATIADQRAS